MKVFITPEEQNIMETTGYMNEQKSTLAQIKIIQILATLLFILSIARVFIGFLYVEIIMNTLADVIGRSITFGTKSTIIILIPFVIYPIITLIINMILIPRSMIRMEVDNAYEYGKVYLDYNNRYESTKEFKNEIVETRDLDTITGQEDFPDGALIKRNEKSIKIRLVYLWIATITPMLNAFVFPAFKVMTK